MSFTFGYTLSAHNPIYPVGNVVTNGFDNAQLCIYVRSRHSIAPAFVPLKFISERLACVLSMLRLCDGIIAYLAIVFTYTGLDSLSNPFGCRSKLWFRFLHASLIAVKPGFYRLRFALIKP